MEIRPERILQIAADLGMGQDVVLDRLGGGALNHMWRLRGAGRDLILRFRHALVDNTIREYLRGLFAGVRLRELGGDYFLRDLAEEARFIETLHAAGIRTPALVAQAEDHLIIAFAEGRPLSEVLRNSGAPYPVLDLLYLLKCAHKAGIVIGDRWGGNEMVDISGRVTLLDFDVALKPISLNHGLFELDVAGALFGALVQASCRAEMVNCLVCFALPALRSWGYDMDRLAEVVARYADFYVSDAKPQTHLSREREHYVEVQSDVYALARQCRA